MGFRLNLKWGLSIQQPPFSSTNSSSSSWPSFHSYKGREIFSDSAKISLSSVMCGDTETVCTDSLRAWTTSSASEISEDNFLVEEMQMEIGRESPHLLYNLSDDDILMPTEGDKSFLARSQVKKASQFGQLVKNLDVLEETLNDSDTIRLKREILVQLEKLGALKLFNKCLSRTLNKPNLVELSETNADTTQDIKASASLDTKKDKVLIPSVRKERRKRDPKKSIDISTLESHSQSILLDPQGPKFASGRIHSKSRDRRRKVARNEAEMSKGVKLLAELERVRKVLEEESGQVVSLSSWADAAGVEIKVLQKRLHYGWYCRDQLLRSTSSLVVYIARNYRGLGLAFEDLIQAGNLGVLQGAERFDHTRGYKFSTYVHYWIRKSMSMLVGRHSRGIRIPITISNTINKIQRARKALFISGGKVPNDKEIAKFTSLSVAKITSAGKCLRIVGSVDEKMGDCMSTRFMEFVPEESILSPEGAVMRQHMMKDLYDMLQGLEPRERQVLILRFGIGNYQCRSLEEIGRLFRVSKEWIRRIERTALSKLRKDDSLCDFIHYLYRR